MRNHWIQQYLSHKQFQWQFMVGRNSIWKLKPRIIRLPLRPGQECKTGERIRIIFPNVGTKDDELFTFISDHCYGKNRNHYAYLRLVDSAVHPIETWSFDKIKFEDVRFDFNDDGSLDIEVSFSFRSVEYRDFLRKVAYKYNS